MSLQHLIEEALTECLKKEGVVSGVGFEPTTVGVSTPMSSMQHLAVVSPACDDIHVNTTINYISDGNLA